jgi:hypothetical protein
MLWTGTYANQFETWAFFNNVDPTQDHVVQFHGPTKTIWILENVEEVLVKEHLYSDWKEWIAIYDHSKYLQAFETEGGRPISATERLGDSYLLINDWVIRQKNADTPVNIIGNLYAYDLAGDPKDPYGNDPDGRRSINSTVSNLVNTIEVPVPALTDAQSWTLQLAYEEARRARAMQTNNVSIASVGEGVSQVDTITVYDDDGTTVLYELRVTGEDCDNRSVQYEKPYCPVTTLPAECP